MADGRWVGVGAPVASALLNAYRAAIERGGSPASTVDVLAYAALAPSPPTYISSRLRAGLQNLTRSRTDSALRYGAGEVDLPLPPDPEVEAVLREVEWWARRLAGRLTPVRPSDLEPWDRRPQWTPAVRALVGDTLAEARVRDVTFAGTAHLLLALLRMRDCAATRFLAPSDAARAATIASIGRDRAIDREAKPYPEPDSVGMEVSRRRVVRAMARFVGLTRLDPWLIESTADIKAQTARLGHGVAGAGHALLALLRVDACVEATGLRLSSQTLARNRGAVLLRSAGLGQHRLAAAVAGLPPVPDPSAAALGEQVGSLRLGDPFLADELTAARKQAGEISLGYRHSATGTTHYLLALLDAPTATAVLDACHVDPTELRARATASLSAIPPAWS